MLETFKDSALPKLHKSVSVIFHYFLLFVFFQINIVHLQPYFAMMVLHRLDWSPKYVYVSVYLPKQSCWRYLKALPCGLCVWQTHTPKRFYQINRYTLQGLNKLPTDRGHIQDHMIGFNAPLSLVTRKHRFSKSTFLFVPRPDGRGVPITWSAYFSLSWNVIVQKQR